MIATTLTMTMATETMASSDSKTLPVAISKMRNEKPTAAVIPVVADSKKALSDSIQHQKTPAVCTPDCSYAGAFSL